MTKVWYFYKIEKRVQFTSPLYCLRKSNVVTSRKCANCPWMILHQWSIYRPAVVCCNFYHSLFILCMLSMIDVLVLLILTVNPSNEPGIITPNTRLLITKANRQFHQARTPHNYLWTKCAFGGINVIYYFVPDLIDDCLSNLIKKIFNVMTKFLFRIFFSRLYVV